MILLGTLLLIYQKLRTEKENMLGLVKESGSLIKLQDPLMMMNSEFLDTFSL